MKKVMAHNLRLITPISLPGFLAIYKILSIARNTAMAKNRNKKKVRSTEMAIDSASDRPQDGVQAMDTSETVATSAPVVGTLRMKKGRPMKRAKNVRKSNAVAKAISGSEKQLMKLSKAESKTLRTKNAKTLYD